MICKGISLTLPVVQFIQIHVKFPSAAAVLCGFLCILSFVYGNMYKKSSSNIVVLHKRIRIDFLLKTI